MDKNYITLTGTVTEIGEEVVIFRSDKNNIKKRVLTIKTSDNQVLFPEIRWDKIDYLICNEIEEGSTVEISFTFEGSEKNGKKYDNIRINTINKI